MDLTPKTPEKKWWSLLTCCTAPIANNKMNVAELEQTIQDLTTRNQELESKVESLAEENSKLIAKLEKEKKRKTDAKERREKLKSKLAMMSGQLNEDFGDEIGTSVLSASSDKDKASETEDNSFT